MLSLRDRLVCAIALAIVPACALRPPSDTVTIPTLVPPLVRTGPAPSARRVRDPGTTEPRTREGRPRGTRILVEWHGELYEATVLATTPDGLTRIHYEGYGPEWDEEVDDERIRPRPEVTLEGEEDPGFD